MRKTKIICTIGPSCHTEEKIEKLISAGMNCARLNFSHGDAETHLENIKKIKRVREELGAPLPIMLDTKGPEMRIGKFAGGKAILETGKVFAFIESKALGNADFVSTGIPEFAKLVQVGDIIKVNNGLLVFKVFEIKNGDVRCKILSGGEISDKKSLSVEGKSLVREYLSEQDKKDIIFGVQNDIDFIAASFVSRAQDVRDIKKLLYENGGEKIGIIAKIENRLGVENIDEICAECEGIMIARGDLGVEIPFEEVPAIQKEIIKKCRLLGKKVITATEMLETMTYNPRPTRAEISDVANAVFDGTSAVMLSGETAAGKYPIESTEAMAKIALCAEQNISYKRRFLNRQFKIQNTVDAISHATCNMAIDIGAETIAVCSLSGTTVRMVSRFRPPADILGLTTDEKTYRKLALSWGVTPVKCEVLPSTEVLFYTAKKLAKETFKLKTGDKIVITGGTTNGLSGNTDIIKLETI